MIDPKKYEAIDPIALIFPPSIAAKIFEGKYPHVPKTSVIQKTVQEMTKEDKGAILTRAKNMMAIAKVVVEAMSTAE